MPSLWRPVNRPSLPTIRMKTAIWYHTLLTRGTSPEPWPLSIQITIEAMEALRTSGLLDACDELNVGINSLEIEAADYALVALPPKAKIIWHGRAFSENLTICALHEWCKTHPGWAVLYFHCKGGASHEPGSPYLVGVSEPWRRTMTAYMVGGWRQCVADLESGADIVCCHWLWNMADGSQHIPAGNFAWLNSNFVASLPSMYDRERIKQDGIGAASSRYEAEVFWGNGRRPVVSQHMPNGGGGVP